MNYLFENMSKKTKLKDTRINQAMKLGGMLAFSLALNDSFKSLEKARIEGSTPETELNMLWEMIIMTIENGPFTPGEA
tara:strand:- start:659 stop:892 length:234 start_codon:yes stop_codon:yes gene_type:complete